MRECGAKTRQGGVCKQPALPNGRCHYHGGKSLAGLASPTYQTGRYSKALPARLAARYATPKVTAAATGTWYATEHVTTASGQEDERSIAIVVRGLT